MRKMRRLVALAFVALVVPMLMGATLTMNVTPNPGGGANKIKGDGKYTLAAGETYSSIIFEVTLKNSSPPQTTSSKAAVDQPNLSWECTLLVAPATYNPTKATLQYLDNKMQVQSLANTDKTKDYKVK